MIHDNRFGEDVYRKVTTPRYLPDGSYTVGCVVHDFGRVSVYFYNYRNGEKPQMVKPDRDLIELLRSEGEALKRFVLERDAIRDRSLPRFGSFPGVEGVKPKPTKVTNIN